MTTPQSITSEIQKLEPSAIIELFEMDATSFGGDLLRFHAGTNGLRQNIVWQGNTYTAFPIRATGFDYSGNGQLPRPKLQVANVTGAITLLVLTYDDLLGAKITRKRTLAKYLDAVNFPARRNLLLNTEDFRNAAEGGAYWSQFDDTGNAVAVITGFLDPQGNYAADKLTANTIGLLQRQVSQAVSSVPNDSAVTNSVFAKAGECTHLRLYVSTRTSPIYYPSALFNLSSGAVVSNSSSGGYTPTSTITNVGDGWYRCSATLPSVGSGATSPAIIIQLAQSNGGNFSSSNIGDGLYLWGAQTEIGTTMTAYQPVGSTWSQNPTADNTAEFPDDIFFIDRKAAETRDVVEFELAAAFDVAGVQLPRRQIIQNVCTWRYRGTECGYAGASYFDANDAPVGSLALDVCGKRLSSCKARFGTNNPLPFGSFPAAGLTR